MTRLACLFAILALAALPAAAGAQISALGAQTTPATATTPAATSTSSGGSSDLSTFDEVLIFVGGIGLIAVIAVVILLDARRRAPATEEDMRIGAADKRHSPADRRRRRARARHARAQRKKNRPR
jgi:hypothetical protein